MSDLRPLTASVSRLTSETFSKKFVALGRILNNWDDIIGPELAVKAQPVKIHYRKPKEKGDNLMQHWKLPPPVPMQPYFITKKT